MGKESPWQLIFNRVHMNPFYFTLTKNRPKGDCLMGCPTGFEPATSAATERRSTTELRAP